MKKTIYPNIEIVIVENNSTQEETFSYYEKIKSEKIKVVTWNGEFNYAAINNYGVKYCSGDYIVFLNNDTEVITDCWIEKMLQLCQRSDVGAVGVCLLYPDNTIQHAGVVIGLGGIAGHAFLGQESGEYGYQARIVSVSDVTAVTAACMMMGKDLFEKIGGFDEEFKVAYNDVDICLRLRKEGLLVVYTPLAKLYHYESKTRGRDDASAAKTKRLYEESELFKKRWSEMLEKGDPNYNRNLSLKKPDFSFKSMEEENEG